MYAITHNKKRLLAISKRWNRRYAAVLIECLFFFKICSSYVIYIRDQLHIRQIMFLSAVTSYYTRLLHIFPLSS